MTTKRILFGKALATALGAGMAFAGAAGAAPTAPVVTRLNITDLAVATTGYPDLSYATGINNRGDVIGYWRRDARIIRDPLTYGYVRTAEGVLTLLTDPTGDHPAVMPEGINRKGEVAGTLTQPHRSGGWPSIPFRWSAATGVVVLPAIAGESYLHAADIDDQGRILVNGGAHAYLYDPERNAYDTLPDLGNGATADDINESGQIVGSAGIVATPNATPVSHAVIWTGRDHKIRDIHGGLPGSSNAHKINNNAEIIGAADTQNYGTSLIAHWDAPQATPTTLGIGRANDINNHGCIVGYTATESAAWKVKGRKVDTVPLGQAFNGIAVNRSGVIAGSVTVDAPASSPSRYPQPKAATYASCPV